MSEPSAVGRQAAENAIRSAVISTAIALCILSALGVWQIQRLHWKQAILAQIDRAERSPPVPLAGTPPRFAKISAHGVLRPAVALYGAFVRDTPDGGARMGAQRLQILDRPEGPLLVDLGWVPTEGAAPPVATGPVTIAGYARFADHPSWYSPDDDPKAHRFYTLDPALIGPALGAPGVPPFTLVAMGGATDTPPVPAIALPRPANNHLQYAFTWFGLAAALGGVSTMWIMERIRKEK